MMNLRSTPMVGLALTALAACSADHAIAPALNVSHPVPAEVSVTVSDVLTRVLPTLPEDAQLDGLRSTLIGLQAEVKAGFVTDSRLAQVNTAISSYKSAHAGNADIAADLSGIDFAMESVNDAIAGSK